MSVSSTRLQSIKLSSALCEVKILVTGRTTVPLAVLDCWQVILSQVVERFHDVVSSGDLEPRKTNSHIRNSTRDDLLGWLIGCTTVDIWNNLALSRERPDFSNGLQVCSWLRREEETIRPHLHTLARAKSQKGAGKHWKQGKHITDYK